MSHTRRLFLKSGSIALVGLGSGLVPIPSFVRHAAAATAGRRRTLVVLFLRGAADGLNIVVPYAERAYGRLRPTIAIPRPRRGDSDSAIELGEGFGLHPALRPLAARWTRRELAVVHATGSPHATRSHFDAQEFMENGTPGIKRTEDGWLNRYMRSNDPGGHGPFRGVALANELPRMLAGPAPALAIQDLRRFDLPARPAGDALREGLLDLYDEAGDPLLTRPVRESLEAAAAVRALREEAYRPAGGAEYPRGAAGRNLMQIAQLIKAGLGVEIAFTDVGGWDHHVGEARPLAGALDRLARALEAFAVDLGDRFADTTVVTLSEFGRTAAENGNAGTDHGHANCALVLGGRVAGGRFWGRWPGLSADRLHERRDLALTTDFRDLMAVLLRGALGATELGPVFPGHRVDLRGLSGLV